MGVFDLSSCVSDFLSADHPMGEVATGPFHPVPGAFLADDLRGHFRLGDVGEVEGLAQDRRAHLFARRSLEAEAAHAFAAASPAVPPSFAWSAAPALAGDSAVEIDPE